MRKVVLAVGCLLLTFGAAAPANAAHKHTTQKAVNWVQRDTAVYVVSTLNILRLDNGQPVSTLFKNQLHVKQYTVEADAVVPDLYYINLVKANKTVAGTFAYKMGWQKPAAITDFGVQSIPRAAPDIISSFHTDHRTKVASFTSTLPS